jgi:acyl carrier protein
MSEQIVQRIARILDDVQKLSGHPRAEISGSTRPIGDLPEFDSLNGVEVTVMLCQEFGFEFPLTNIFVSDDGAKARSVSQVARCVKSLIGT